MNAISDLGRPRGTAVLLVVLAVWGLGVVTAAQTGVYGLIDPRYLATLIAS